MTFELEQEDIDLLRFALDTLAKSCAKHAMTARVVIGDAEMAEMFEAKRVECERLDILLT